MGKLLLVDCIKVEIKEDSIRIEFKSFIIYS